jgi:tetratricopeptide (TPR) repeat protein
LRKFWFGFAVSLALVGSPALAESSFDQGVEQMRSGGTAQAAIDTFSQELKQSPNSARTYTLRGSLFLQQKSFDEAIKDFSEAIRLAPKNTELLIDRGITYLQAGQDAALALTDFQSAVALEPNSPDYQYLLGLALAKTEDYDKAIEAFTTALQLQPDDLQILMSRGDAHRNAKDFAVAIADYNTALSLVPDSADVLVRRGAAYTGLKNNAAAMADFAQALRIDPNTPDVYLHRGNLRLWNLRDLSGAIRDYNLGIKQNPNCASCYLGRGQAYRVGGNLLRADQDWERAAALFQEQGNVLGIQRVVEALRQLSVDDRSHWGGGRRSRRR